MTTLLEVGDAVAARYAAGTLAAPTGSPTLAAVKLATARPPAQIGAVLPAVLVFYAGSTYRTGGGSRFITSRWRVQLFYQLASQGAWELAARDVARWVEVMARAQSVASLGALVSVVRTLESSTGAVSFAGVDYHGGELIVETQHSEAWTPAG